MPAYYHPGSHDYVEKDYICSLPKDSGMHRCDDLQPYTTPEGVECNGTLWDNRAALAHDGQCVDWNRYYTLCNAGDKNPFQGAISFDNIGLAWVAIFLVISLEAWTDIMYYVQDAHSFWDWIYFVLLIVVSTAHKPEQNHNLFEAVNPTDRF